MKLAELEKLISEDLKAYNSTDKSFAKFCIRYFKTPGFKITVWMRCCKFLSDKVFLRVFYLLARLYYRHLQVKYGIQIGYKLNIKGGFSINHYGGIVIGQGANIWKNFNIRHSLTVGHVNGKTPIIGDNVLCGANVVIIGGITIGDNCIIGAGSVVVKSIPDNSVVVGNPAHVIKKISDKNKM